MSAKPTIAVVPVKALVQAKSRLSVRLDADGRRRLVLAMLADVLAALGACPQLGGIIVVTPDDDVATAARERGADVLLEDAPAGDLNGAIALGIAQAADRGAGAVVVVPGDVPLATPGELTKLLATSKGMGVAVAVAPSRDGNGTNALVLTPPDVLAPAFGPNSCQRHLSQARAKGLSRRVIELPGLGFDVDEPGDLDRLRELDRYSWLHDAMAQGSRISRA
jgi:2-phospho-L-lactate guanylyltransferase